MVICSKCNTSNEGGLFCKNCFADLIKVKSDITFSSSLTIEETNRPLQKNNQIICSKCKTSNEGGLFCKNCFELLDKRYISKFSLPVPIKEEQILEKQYEDNIKKYKILIEIFLKKGVIGKKHMELLRKKAEDFGISKELALKIEAELYYEKWLALKNGNNSEKSRAFLEEALNLIPDCEEYKKALEDLNIKKNSDT